MTNKFNLKLKGTCYNFKGFTKTQQGTKLLNQQINKIDTYLISSKKELRYLGIKWTYCGMFTL